MADNNLFIFVHIPKTSGEVIKRNIERSLPEHAMIRTSYEHFESYFDITKNENNFYTGSEHFHRYVTSLSDKQKNRIKLLAGHNSYYGIHEFFPHKAMYATFLRQPLLRTLSLYNFELMAWKLYSAKTEPLNLMEVNFLKRMRENFLINNDPPSFEQWINEIYDSKIPFYYTMSRYLSTLGFSAQNDLNALLDKFYFVGITETHEEDSFFLYNCFGVKRFNADKNASPSYVSLSGLNADTLNIINKKNEEDIELYRLAIRKNQLFKRQSRHFYWLNLKRKLMKFII
jgi:hypothetical protein